MNPALRAGVLPVAVRAVGRADFSRIAQIYAHFVLHGTGTFEIDPPDADEMRRRHTDVAQRGLPWFVAETEGLVVGYAYAGVYRARPAYERTIEDSLYLDPAWHRRGIGRMLLQAVIHACTDRGCRQMIAVIGDSANVASIELHRSLGFAEAGVLKDVGLKFGRWIDTVFMQRALGEGAASVPGSPQTDARKRG